jgi:ketopantoate reductase
MRHARSQLRQWSAPPSSATARNAAAAPALMQLLLFCPSRFPTQVGPRTLVMPTQNGVDAPATLGALLGAGHVVGGYTRITSLLTGPGAVNHTAIHPAVQGTGALPDSAPWAAEELARAAAVWSVRALLACACGCWLRRYACVRVLTVGTARGRASLLAQRSPFLRLVVEDDVLLSMWRKLTIMAAYSSVTALARCPIGPIVDSPDARGVLLQARHPLTLHAACLAMRPRAVAGHVRAGRAHGGSCDASRLLAH